MYRHVPVQNVPVQPVVSSTAQLPLPQSTTPNLDLRPVPLDERRAALEYNDLLATLTWNSKEIIDNLTKIAAENTSNVNGIAHGIEQRILHAVPDAKLPYLYLLDSILKNIGDVYIHRFRANLPAVFRNVYTHANQQVRNSLHRVLNTWDDVFGIAYVASLRSITVEIDGRSNSNNPPSKQLRQAYSNNVNGNGNRSRNNNNTTMMPSNNRPTRIPRVSRPLSLQPNYQNVQPNHPTRTRNIVAVPIPKRQVQPQVGQVQPQQHAMGIIPGLPGASMAMYNTNNSIQGQQGMMNNTAAGMAPYGMGTTTTTIPAPGFEIRPEGGVQPMNSVPMGMMPPNGVAGALGFNATLQQAERMMGEITRKNLLGNISNNDVVALHQLIADQLRCAPPYPVRERFLEMQRRLATVAASSRTTPNINMHPAYPPPNQTHGVVVGALPVLSPGALTNLASSLANANNNNNNAMNPLSASTAASSLRPPLKFSAIRNTPHAAFVRAIYTDLAHLSKSDAMRFATKEELREHLDWLFARNRSKRARERNLATGGLSRCWYDAMDVFVGEKSANNNNINSATPSINNNNNTGVEVQDKEECVYAKGGAEEEICPVCQEGLQPFWHEDEQAWMIKEAVRNNKGAVFHARCAASVGDIDSFEDTLFPPTPTTTTTNGVVEGDIYNKKEEKESIAPTARSTLLRGAVTKPKYNSNSISKNYVSVGGGRKSNNNIICGNSSNNNTDNNNSVKNSTNSVLVEAISAEIERRTE